jgi:TolB-like protein/Tfp pilus assembly protein PilF
VTEPLHAVFLSYASQDAEAAQQICEALRAAGIEVWFDQGALRGGDAWDLKIRELIHDCRLFMPIVSASTEARVEGYFRREWKLAVDRTHDLSERAAFLVPVVIDSTAEAKADVPDVFRRIQWTRLPGAQPTPAFVERIRRLITPEASEARKEDIAGSASGSTSALPVRQSALRKTALRSVGAIVALACAYFVADKLWLSKQTVSPGPVSAAAPQHAPSKLDASSAFNPPPHSVAVLPFTNLSGDPKQEYFSDGISEELINALAHIESLQVTARTSAFSFKGQNVDIGTIARKLNVAAILEGSIRRDGNTVRITAQLINTVTGYHLWSEDYDRNVKSILALQTDIAITVANHLRAKLLGDEVVKIEMGGTRIPAAYDAYLRAEQLFPLAENEAQYQRVIAAFDEAIRLDPNFAAAYAGRAVALIDVMVATDRAAIRVSLREQARSSAEQALKLAPDYGFGHSAMWFVRALGYFDFQGAAPEVERAIALDPGNARIQSSYAGFHDWLGHSERAIAAQRLAVRLDPRSYRIRLNLAAVLESARRYAEAEVALADAEAINPAGIEVNALRANMMIEQGQYAKAKNFCISAAAIPEGARHYCLALTLHALGDHEGAERELVKFQTLGDSAAFENAEILAQWGRLTDALRWLGIAERLRDPRLQYIRTSLLLEPLRSDPAFKALERRLNWPP